MQYPLLKTVDILARASLSPPISAGAAKSFAQASRRRR